MLEFGNPYIPNRSFIPPIQCSKYVLTPAIVRASNASPFVFFPGIPGSLIAVDRALIVKQAGLAYTLNAATAVRIQYQNAVNIQSASLVAGMFNVDALTVSFLGYGPLIYTVYPALGIIGSGLQFLTTAGAMSGGDGDVHIYLQYRIWPFGVNLS